MTSSYSDLRGKRILVTGASSGIGRQTAIALAEQGVRVIASGRHTERLMETISMATLPANAAMPFDINDEEQRKVFVSCIDKLDGICHCAGTIAPFPLRYLHKKNFDPIMETNFRSPALLISSLLDHKKISRGASIVFISSIASTFGYKGGAAYSASKAALEAYSRNICLEHAGQRIRSNCIQAAMVQTPIYTQTENLVSRDSMDKHESRYPLGTGEPEDVAEAAKFLLSDASRWISGTTLVLDGGLTAGQ